MKKILFVVIPYGGWSGISTARKNQFTAFPYGVMSIATYLKRNTDAACKVFDCNISENYLQDMVAAIDQFDPDIIALSMMFDTSYKYLTGILDLLSPARLVVIGGASAMISYSDILKEQPRIDAVCYGEGELPFLRLYYDGKTILQTDPSWVTRTNSHEPVKSKIENLDEVIDIDYSLVDINNYSGREAFSPFASQTKERQFYIITSRGCPFKCQFCMNSANPDKTIRYASVDAVIDHVHKLVAQGMTVLTFYDDQLLFNKKRAKEIFRRLIPFGLKIECPNGLSVAFIDDELARLMKTAGMSGIKLAIESGSPYVLNELMHKPLKVGMVKPVVDILHRHGFWVQGFFVVGMPGETDEHREETSNLIKDAGLDWVQINTACPTRGSLLYTDCIAKGYISPLKMGDFAFKEYCIHQPDYTIDHIKDAAYRMNLDANFVNNRSMKIGEYDIAIRAFLDVLTLVPNHTFAYYFLSVAYTKLGNLNRASDYFSKYIDVAKDPFWQKWVNEFNLPGC